jgi:DNA-binding transcriptional LysR family regulator
MNLHQFRFVQEAVRRDLNLTETAKALFTSQPGVSKAILELEGELGVDIFARHGKRLRRVTEPGREVLKAIEVIMREVGNLKRIGDEFSKQDAGTLSIATTHSQARYFLPVPIAQMRKRFPKVNISLHQGTPEQVARMVFEEVADFGLATESLDDYADLVTLPCYAWQHVLVLPAGHPADADRPRLDRGSGAAAADLVSPVVLRPKEDRRRVCDPQARSQHRPRGDRRRRHQDLRATRPRHRHRRRDRDARGRHGLGPGGASGRAPVRPERRPHRVQARRATCATSSMPSPR